MSVDENGYRIYESIFSSAECDTLIHELGGAAGGRSRAGARHLMAYPAIASLAADRRMMRIVESVLGDGAVPFRATLFEKSVATNYLISWHQDTALPLAKRFESVGWGPWSRKRGIDYCHAPVCALTRILAMRLHLDPSERENGPLRVVPGSHRCGVLTDQQVLEWVGTNIHVECLLPRGGVLAMRPLLIHASSKARVPAPRRVLHIEYADSLELAPGIQLALA